MQIELGTFGLHATLWREEVLENDLFGGSVSYDGF